MKIYSFTFEVSSEDIDFNGHVNNIRYLSWMIDAATKHSLNVGCGYERCIELGGTWVARSHKIEYKSPAFKYDTLKMETWIEDIGAVLSTRCYKITCVSDDALILEGQTQWVFVDTKKMKPMKIPTEIVESFKTQS